MRRSTETALRDVHEVRMTATMSVSNIERLAQAAQAFSLDGFIGLTLPELEVDHIGLYTVFHRDTGKDRRTGVHGLRTRVYDTSATQVASDINGLLNVTKLSIEDFGEWPVTLDLEAALSIEVPILSGGPYKDRLKVWELLDSKPAIHMMARHLIHHEDIQLGDPAFIPGPHQNHYGLILVGQI